VAIVQVYRIVHGVPIHNNVWMLIGMVVLLCVIKKSVMDVFVVHGLDTVTVMHLLHVQLVDQTVPTIQDKVAVHVLHSLTVHTVLILALVWMAIAMGDPLCVITMIHVPLLGVVATVLSAHGTATVIVKVVLSPKSNCRCITIKMTVF